MENAVKKLPGASATALNMLDVLVTGLFISALSVLTASIVYLICMHRKLENKRRACYMDGQEQERITGAWQDVKIKMYLLMGIQICAIVICVIYFIAMGR